MSCRQPPVSEPQEIAMSKTVRLALAVAVSLVSLSSANAMQASAQQRAACTPDVWRLCAGEIPNVSKIIACMQKKRDQLSPACSAVFMKETK
jgi:hypothetical protein